MKELKKELDIIKINISLFDCFQEFDWIFQNLLASAQLSQ